MRIVLAVLFDIVLSFADGAYAQDRDRSDACGYIYPVTGFRADVAVERERRIPALQRRYRRADILKWLLLRPLWRRACGQGLCLCAHRGAHAFVREERSWAAICAANAEREVNAVQFNPMEPVTARR
ncbi:MAG: hypothetical protein ABUS57_00735 [Pseudomonadota bacterium]